MSCRLVFMGSPAFALPSFAAARRFAQQRGGSVVGVFSQPDRPSGRGKQLTPVPVTEEARRHTLPLFQPGHLRKGDDARPAIDFLHAQKPDVIVVVAYGLLLPREVLAIPRLGCVNVHTSLLPKYRGAAPANWAILNGEKETGVSTMLLDEGMDTGPILMQRKTPIGPDETAEQLNLRMSEFGAELLFETLSGLLDGTLTPKPQPTEGITMAPLMEKTLGQVKWTEPAQKIHDQVRALVPWPGAYTLWNGEMLKIHRTQMGDKKQLANAPVGTVLSVSNSGIEVMAGDGHSLWLLELQKSGGKRQPATDFSRGARLAAGAILGV